MFSLCSLARRTGCRLAFFAMLSWGGMSCAAPLETCVDCHGVDGLSRRAGVPHIDGQPEDVFVAMLDAYRGGRRATEVAVHRTADAAAAADLARHYAGQRLTRPIQTLDPARTKRGEQNYDDRCSKCHLDAGRESDKEAPRLAGQDVEYLFAQMRDFKSGRRPFPFMMDEAYRNLDDDALLSLAHFFAAQPLRLEPKRKRR